VSQSSKYQQNLLEAEDPRFHAIGPAGTGLGMMATVEHFAKREVSFGLPSAPALFLNMARRAHAKRTLTDLSTVFTAHPQGIWPENHKPLFDYFEDFSCEVIFSFTALEAFANEVIPQGFTYQFKSDKKAKPVILDKSEIERRVSLAEKLNRVIPEACSCPSPKGAKSWQAFKELKSVRDRLIHLKSIDRKASGPENQTVWGLMLDKQSVVFAELTVRVIGHYQTLVKDRRWFNLFTAPKP
jgi:hypothetical protein